MNRSAELVADVPLGVLTVTSTGPVPAGLTAVIDVPETTLTPVAAAVPKATVSPVRKPLPVMVTVVPPTVGPPVGLMPVTVGAVAADAGEAATRVIPVANNADVAPMATTERNAVRNDRRPPLLVIMLFISYLP